MDTGNSLSGCTVKETEEIEASKNSNEIPDATPMTNGLVGKGNMNGISEEPNEELVKQPNEELTKQPNEESTKQPNGESAKLPIEESAEQRTEESKELTEESSKESAVESTEKSTEEPTDDSNELKQKNNLIEPAVVPNGIEDQKGNAHSSESMNGSSTDKDNGKPYAENGPAVEDIESLPQETNQASLGSTDTAELEKLEETTNPSLRTNPETLGKMVGSETGVKFAGMGQIKGGDQVAVNLTTASSAEDSVDVHKLNNGAVMMNGKEGIHNEDSDRIERMPYGGD